MKSWNWCHSDCLTVTKNKWKDLLKRYFGKSFKYRMRARGNTICCFARNVFYILDDIRMMFTTKYYTLKLNLNSTSKSTREILSHIIHKSLSKKNTLSNEKKDKISIYFIFIVLFTRKLFRNSQKVNEFGRRRVRNIFYYIINS